LTCPPVRKAFMGDQQLLREQLSKELGKEEGEHKALNGKLQWGRREQIPIAKVQRERASLEKSSLPCSQKEEIDDRRTTLL